MYKFLFFICFGKRAAAELWLAFLFIYFFFLFILFDFSFYNEIAVLTK